ncbi:MAG: hypothetical protein A3F91_02030 [Flavobacteria bacterium RIFCSPLOWO2_12_FULL_35_11]|nr:MAG: hypothetical protein A3F91_02030 [Flavobacteria bacterium RIFCSPLOWO2_12_FULL_35_11]
MKLTKPVISTKECCQEHAGEIFNIKLAIRFKETWEQIKFLNSRYGDFQVKTALYNFTIEIMTQGKWGTSLGVANSCLFLSTDASKSNTGEALSVDSGRSLW